MKTKFFVSCLFVASLFSACDDTTDDLGASLTGSMDKIVTSMRTFDVRTQSIKADSVYSMGTAGFLGMIKDPETNSYVKGNFMTQFHILENYEFPAKDKMPHQSGGNVIADSCELRLFFNEYSGDSLAPMKLTVYEMERPMEESVNYYSNFDPAKHGFIRNGGFKKEMTYTLKDQAMSDKELADTTRLNNIRIPLDEPYVDKNGKRYNNLGTYIINKYYENPASFKNFSTFRNDVLPGLYIKHKNGLGAMAYIMMSQLNIYFTYQQKDSTMKGMASFPGTEEVLQTTNTTTDRASIDRLVNDDKLTYIKSPSGIFTEVTLPVDEILEGHKNDSINAVKIDFHRINNSLQNEYSFKHPTTLLLIPKSETNSFFEQRHIPDNKTSFISVFDEKVNGWSFSNISGLVTHMARNKAEKDWNKAVLIPVSVTYSQLTNSGLSITRITHDMRLSSTKLIGGSNTDTPVKAVVIYTKLE